MENFLNKFDLLLRAVKNCGDIAIDLRRKGLQVEKKDDGTKVTNADKDLDLFLIKTIRESLNNQDLIISEEDVGAGNRPVAEKGQSFWSIDPIDSTKSFIVGNPYYSVNIAYIVNNEPVIGIIYAPAFRTLWYGIVGKGAFKQVKEDTPVQIFAREVPKSGSVLMSSEEQVTPKEVMEDLNIREEIKIPSSIKFCFIAEGTADYYFRKRNKACDWDISSGHALIVAAGGSVSFKHPDESFAYGIPPYLAPSLLATGKK